MSTSFGADTTHVEWFMLKRADPYNDATTGLATFQALTQTMVHNFGGRSHWGKSGLHYASAPVLAQRPNPTAK